MSFSATLIDGQETQYNTLDEVISNLSNIRDLYITCNNLECENVKKLAEALKVNTTLKTLDISNNNIQNEGAKAIAEALKVNTTFKTLRLRSNNIQDKGAEAIAESLKQNKTLKILSLYDNNIQDKGAQAIAEALNVNISLMDLDLSKNSISDKCFKSIADSMTNYTLLYLHTMDIDSQRTWDCFNGYSRLRTGESAINEICKRNRNLINIVANNLISNTDNQSILHTFFQMYRYVMLDYLIDYKKVNLDHARNIFKDAIQNYNPARALFRNGLIANEVDIIPQDILNEIAKYTLPRGHRVIADAQAHAKAPYGNLSTQY